MKESQAKSILTVHPPIPKKQLGRYRNEKGTYLIRFQGKVIYIGHSIDIYKAVLRLFQKGGVLSHLVIEKMTIEVVFSTIRRPSVTDVLRGDFMPEYIYKKGKLPKKYSFYEERQAKRIKAQYYEQSRFTVVTKNQEDGTGNNEL